MSSDEPKRSRADGAPDQGFARGRIQWSRPPQPVFRVGPLPRTESSPFVTTPRPGAGILTGSMVPPPRTDAPRAAARQPYAAPAFEPAVDAAEETVEAFTDPKLEPIEIVAEVEAPEPAATAWTPSPEAAVPESDEPKPAPRSLPSVVVTPAIYATVSAAIETVTKKDRWILVVAILAVVITGGFIWLATLPSGGGAPLDLNAPPPPAQGLTVEVVEPTVSTEPVAEVAPQRQAPLENRAAPSAPTSSAPTPTARAPQSAAPVAAPPSAPSTQPRPYIETAPLVVEPPTAARPTPTDPDAPISTGPQPLN